MQKLREIVNSTKDPVTIEHTVKQIKSIEKLHSDCKRAIKSQSRLNSSDNEIRSSIDFCQEPVLQKRLHETARKEGKSFFMTTDCDDQTNLKIQMPQILNLAKDMSI